MTDWNASVVVVLPERDRRDIHDISPTPVPEAPALSHPQMFGSYFLHQQRDFKENEQINEIKTGQSGLSYV